MMKVLHLHTVIPKGSDIDNGDDSLIVTSMEPNSSCACSHDFE